MRKDYIASDIEHDSEDAFVERFWTRVWAKEGGPQGQFDRIPKKDEYRLISPYFAELPQKARILDGGCGLGEWVLALHSMGYDVVGMDLSRRTVEQLQSRFPGVPFISGDIRATEFAANSFDAYLSWGVFEHFEAGPQDCLREAWRILKPRGLLFISVPLDNLRHSILGALDKPESSFLDSSRFYQYRFTRAELAREINLAGFDLLSIHPIHKQQGLLRSLHHGFGMHYEWFVTKGLAFALAPFIPGCFIAHMALAIAKKKVRG